MIAIEAECSGFLRVMPESESRAIGFHRKHGWSADATRATTRSRSWLFRFQLRRSADGSWGLECLQGCAAERITEGGWRLDTASGVYRIFLPAACERKALRQWLERAERQSWNWMMAAAL